MGNNLTSAGALAYQGTNAASPSNVTVHYNAPTANYYQGFQIGDFWVHRISPTSNQNELWVLMGVAGNVANWVLLSNSSGALLTLTGNTGGAVGPTAGNINVVGASGITVAGNPGTSTLTISPSGGSIVATLTGNSGGAVSPSAGNINVVGDTTTINIVGNPGTHTLTASAVGTGLIQSLTTDDTHVVTPTAGTINIHGGTGITTTGTIGPNTVTIATSGTVATLYSEDSGTATPSAGVLNVHGDTHNVTTTGSGNTVTVGLTGITQHSVQVGAASNALTQLAVGTTGQILMGVTGADPVWSSLQAQSWTPVLSFGGSSVGIVYAVQEGHYQIIGDFVFFSGAIALTSKGAAAGTALISGLPAASGAMFSSQFAALAFGALTFAAGNTYAWCPITPGAATMSFSASGSGNGIQVLTNTAFANGTNISFTGFYFTA